VCYVCGLFLFAVPARYRVRGEAWASIDHKEAVHDFTYVKLKPARPPPHGSSKPLCMHQRILRCQTSSNFLAVLDEVGERLHEGSEPNLPEIQGGYVSRAPLKGSKEAPLQESQIHKVSKRKRLILPLTCQPDILIHQVKQFALIH
jgi:hypothetical protein